MEDVDVDISTVLPQKDAKSKKKSGGFQSMGLSQPILRAIFKKGYKVPTPIQRKAIPVVMQGKNVVAMARTGSGKTAAFLVPMLEKLKCRVGKAGARALIFSPTRELAIQTMKFAKELGINTDLKTALILGGEKMEDQFAAIHESPDIIIATPGRFLHVVIEMDLKLSSVEYVVFDEADRLFEMGFQEQLHEVLHRLPSERQTLLFSATLPKVLVEFVKAGVEDPILIRLDVDLQISENLKSSYFLCRNDDKPAVLLHLLKNVIKLPEELTVVFLATKHHVEYMKDILEKAEIPCSYIYSSLDQMARNIHIAKFRNKKVGVLLVTDIAARGIDIPLLDNVINYNFPAKPKLYVHRVGRVARAGRSGKAFSIISADETPYLLDLHLFLGKPLKFAKFNMETEDSVCGAVPQNIIDDESEVLHCWHKLSVDLSSMQKVTENAYKKYIKSRPAPSSESVKRMKEFSFSAAEIHPLFKDASENEKNKILAEMKNYRPNTTIFELGPLAKTQANVIMREKRKSHCNRVKTQPKSAADNQETYVPLPHKALEKADEKDLMGFTQHVTIKENMNRNKKQKKSDYKDTEHYLSYVSTEHYKEKGLGLESSFAHQAAGAVLDFTKDDDESVRKNKNVKYWDRKKKKFIQAEHEGAKKMKTESGVWIPKSYKSDLYKKWQEKNKIKYQHNNDESDEESQFGKNRIMQPKGKRGRNKDQSGKPLRREMKTKEEILKTRTRKERLMNHQKEKHKSRTKRKNMRKK
ncbi:ATP-dependent RNA helicase DDX54-like [Uloborus diversus]|uniref:ATP-dependent RNA helicase DDX54-like n=1 Tax=Uloborus diversus TaxID=327109 RepID=UPI002409C60E|nr:ATP-dependent RNA helicase DDX54-like [Uloborus diversus]